jgi:hypothetical protein
MGWYLDLKVAKDTPVSPDASNIIRLLSTGVMPPFNGQTLSATMELIEEEILLHTEAKTHEERFKRLARTLPNE